MTDRKKTMLLFTVLAALGYITWHGHRLGTDCFFCKYRGMAFAGGTMGLGWIAANS